MPLGFSIKTKGYLEENKRWEQLYVGIYGDTFAYLHMKRFNILSTSSMYFIQPNEFPFWSKV